MRSKGCKFKMAAHMNELSEFLCAENVDKSWDEKAICRLQAYMRAFLIRKKFQQLRSLYEEIVNEVEGDIRSSTDPAIVHWKTHLPCRPGILTKPRRSSSALKNGQGTKPSNSTQELPPNSDSSRDACRDVEASTEDQEMDSKSGVKVQDTVGGSERVDGSQWTRESFDVKGGITFRPEEDFRHQTPAQSQLLPSSHHQQTEEDEEYLQRQSEDSVHPEQNLDPSEEGRRSQVSQDPTKSSDLSVSGSTHSHPGNRSAMSSTEYTPDFESCTSTASSQDADSERDREHGTTPGLSEAALIEEQSAVEDVILPDGMESREVSSERMGHEVMKLTDSDDSSPDGSKTIENAAVDSSSDCSKTNRIDKILDHQHLHKTPAAASAMATSAKPEMGTPTSSTGDGTMSSDSERRKSLGHVEEGSPDERVKDKPISQGVQKQSGHSDEQSETETAPNSSHHLSGSQGDKRSQEIGVDTEDSGGWREGTDEDETAGRSSPVIPETRIREPDITVAADMTSIWSNDNSFAEMQEADYPTDLEELQMMRSNVAMELLWVQQAIDSRKNYLRLKSDIQPSVDPVQPP